jgi:hypothetical protein
MSSKWAIRITKQRDDACYIQRYVGILFMLSDKRDTMCNKQQHLSRDNSPLIQGSIASNYLSVACRPRGVWSKINLFPRRSTRVRTFSNRWKARWRSHNSVALDSSTYSERKGTSRVDFICLLEYEILVLCSDSVDRSPPSSWQG